MNRVRLTHAWQADQMRESHGVYSVGEILGPVGQMNEIDCQIASLIVLSSRPVRHVPRYQGGLVA